MSHDQRTTDPAIRTPISRRAALTRLAAAPAVLTLGASGAAPAPPPWLADSPDWLPPILERIARALPAAEGIWGTVGEDEPAVLSGAAFAEKFALMIERSGDPAFHTVFVSASRERKPD